MIINTPFDSPVRFVSFFFRQWEEGFGAYFKLGLLTLPTYIIRDRRLLGVGHLIELKWQVKCYSTLKQMQLKKFSHGDTGLQCLKLGLESTYVIHLHSFSFSCIHLKPDQHQTNKTNCLKMLLFPLIQD